MSSETSIQMVYVTVKDNEEAACISRAVVEEGMAACVNILGPIQSIYRWEGKITQGSEIALVIKSTQSALPSLINRIKELHSYDCPAISAWAIEQGNSDYFDWIKQCVQKN